MWLCIKESLDIMQNITGRKYWNLEIYRGLGWKTKFCCLFLLCSQLCIPFCKDRGWRAQLKSKQNLPRLCNKAALSMMRKNVAINIFKLQRELNRDLLGPGQVLDGMEENLLSSFLDELISWCVSPFLHASFTMVTEMWIHSICEHRHFQEMVSE